MNRSSCPGSLLIREPRPETLKCPGCDADVEIWSDELSANCLRCGTGITRSGGLSCLDWCRAGRECVGEEAYERYLANKTAGGKQAGP